MTISTSLRLRTALKLSSAALVLTLIGPSVTYAEGVVQMGIGQDLLDFQRAIDQGYAIDDASASMFVDILSVGEVINISLCGEENQDDISVDIYAPSDDATPVSTWNLTSGNLDCADPMTAPLPNPLRHTATETGAYRLVLQNTSKSGTYDSAFKRYDITVTPDALTDPDPTASDGRLWAYSYNFIASGFAESESTDANYYSLVPGGRPDTSYV